MFKQWYSIIALIFILHIDSLKSEQCFRYLLVVTYIYLHEGPFHIFCLSLFLVGFVLPFSYWFMGTLYILRIIILSPLLQIFLPVHCLVFYYMENFEIFIVKCFVRLKIFFFILLKKIFLNSKLSVCCV